MPLFRRTNQYGRSVPFLASHRFEVESLRSRPRVGPSIGARKSQALAPRADQNAAGANCCGSHGARRNHRARPPPIRGRCRWRCCSSSLGGVHDRRRHRCGRERAYRATAKDYVTSQTPALECKIMRILLCRRLPPQTGGGLRAQIRPPIETIAVLRPAGFLPTSSVAELSAFGDDFPSDLLTCSNEAEPEFSSGRAYRAEK
jgi:hypothetical protein